MCSYSIPNLCSAQNRERRYEPLVDLAGLSLWVLPQDEAAEYLHHQLQVWLLSGPESKTVVALSGLISDTSVKATCILFNMNGRAVPRCA
jgi:hypothetical protein